MEGPPEAKKLKVSDKGMKENTFLCDLCDPICARKNTLMRHKEAKHEGIRYPCDQCEYSASQKGALKRHKEAFMRGSDTPVINVNLLRHQRVI